MKLTKDIYKLRELEPMLGVTQRTIYRYITEDKLNAIKVGGQWRVEKAELARFLKGGK